jgi:hypothetical protein
MKPRSKSAHLGALIDGITSLSPAQRECLRYFKNLYVRHGGAPLFPSVQAVAAAIQVSVNSARRHIQRLRELEILIPLAREHGGLGPTVYEFRAHRLQELATPPKLVGGTPPKMAPPHPSQIGRRVFNEGRAPKPPVQGKPSEDPAIIPMDGEGWGKSNPGWIHATSGSVH